MSDTGNVLVSITHNVNLPGQPTTHGRKDGRLHVIGLYGVSGVGKTSLIAKLLENGSCVSPKYRFYEGSITIDKVSPGGFIAFGGYSPARQEDIRRGAIAAIDQQCISEQKIGVVAGHYMLWNDDRKDAGKVVAVDKDWDVYTHIVYLRGDPKTIRINRQTDEIKTRTNVSAEHLEKWQDQEIEALRKVCREHKILMTIVRDKAGGTPMVEKVANLLDHFLKDNTETANQARILESLQQHDLMKEGVFYETRLLLDADRTLASQDTGKLWWDVVRKNTGKPSNDPLKELYSSLGYNYFSFRQAALLYEEYADEFHAICSEVASKVKPYPEILSLLKIASSKPHVKTAILTCGLPDVWKLVLRRENINNVTVIGSGRVFELKTVTPAVKGAVVDELHKNSHRVTALGDSPVDIEMLQKADIACVVVGKMSERSKTMESKLSDAIDNGLKALQIVIPFSEKPRLDVQRLPHLHPYDYEMGKLLRPHAITATNKGGTKLLQTPMRNSKLSGHQLRNAHSRVGFYLANEYVTEILGTETYNMEHVLNQNTEGYRLFHEARTLIVPLMRGGEPMAFGVSEAFPKAKFRHATKPDDIHKELINMSDHIILVDAVVHNGASILKFVKYLKDTVSWEGTIIIVAGVVQEDVMRDSELIHLIRTNKDVSLVTLRVSETKYKGRGGTDTGNRLFNTTELD